MIDVHVSAPAGVNIIAVPKPGPADPPPLGGSLADLAASLAPGTWGELLSANIAGSLNDPLSPNTHLPFHYCNSAPWDGSGISFIGGDHGGSPGFSRYDAPTNRWAARILSPGSHGYNFTTADGATVYRLICGGVDPVYDWSRDPGLYKWNGATLDFFCDPPEPLRQVIAHHPICYWPGRGVFCWSGNTGACYLLNMQTKTWTLLGQVNSSGVYHCVVAYAHDCMVFGGGNDNGTGNAVKLWRIAADATITPMPASPHPIGIYNGSNLCAGPDGNVYALGFNEHHKLDMTTMQWSQLPNPPVGTLYPNDHDATFSCNTPYGIIYIMGRSINGNLDIKMRLYRCGGTS